MNRSKQQPVTPTLNRLKKPSLEAVATAVLITFLTSWAQASEAKKMTPMAGGISPKPVITSVKSKDQKLELEWKAFVNGPFQIEKSPGWNGAGMDWQSVGTVSNATTLAVPMEGNVGFVRVQAPAPNYAGAEKCGICHIDTHENWATTVHAGALETLKKIGQDKNSSCLPCHTVGFGAETGYIDEATTPHLAGVQCENCHGPAGDHAAHPSKKRPLITLAGQMCGGCHTDAHHPTYDEWESSKHAEVNSHTAEYFLDPANGLARQNSCGACHSGATRIAFLNGVEDGEEPDMPSGEEAATTGITCAVCHNPHAKTANPAQLRFPLASKVPYTYTTSAKFSENYNPEVQTCAQCHNSRGAKWTDTSRPPHHSVQYNLLIGKGGYDAEVAEPPQSAHMDVEKQCAQCHTHAHAPDQITEQTPAFTGHDFKPTLEGCLPCHYQIAGLLKEAVQADTKQQIGEVKALLDQWGLTKAPEDLRAKYGALAWEYNNIGQLSQPTAEAPKGPSADEQKSIPDSIKQARYNLYLVEHDGSYGVHNGNYTRFLLGVARDKVKAEL